MNRNSQGVAGFSTILSYAVSDLRYRKLTTALNLASVTIACMYLLTLGFFGHGLWRMQEGVVQESVPTRIVASSDVADTAGRFTVHRMQKMQGLPGVRSVFPHIELNIRLSVGSGREMMQLAESSVPNDPAVPAKRLLWGRPFQEGDTDALLIAEEAWEKLGGTPGGSEPEKLLLEVSRRTADGQEQVRKIWVAVVGVLRGSSNGRVYLPLALIDDLDRYCTGKTSTVTDSKSLAWMKTVVSDLKTQVAGDESEDSTRTASSNPSGWLRCNVDVDSVKRVEEVSRTLRNRGWQVQDRLDEVRSLALLGRVLASAVALFCLGVLFNTVLSVFITSLMNVKTRIHEMGLLRVLGMGNRQIARIYALQGTVIGFVATLVALAAVALIEPLVRPLIFRMLSIAPNAIPLGSVLDLGWLMAITGGVAVLFSLAGVLLPTLWACRLAPVEALRRHE